MAGFLIKNPKKDPVIQAVLEQCEKNPDVCKGTLRQSVAASQPEGLKGAALSASSPGSESGLAKASVQSSDNFLFLGGNTLLTTVVVPSDSALKKYYADAGKKEPKTMEEVQNEVIKKAKGAMREAAALSKKFMRNSHEAEQVLKLLADAQSVYTKARFDLAKLNGKDAPTSNQQTQIAADIIGDSQRPVTQESKTARKNEDVKSNAVTSRSITQSNSVTVKHDDTLFSIAGANNDVLAAAKTAVGESSGKRRSAQWLAALAYAVENPRAIGPTINDLKANTTLREPSADTVRSVADALNRKGIKASELSHFDLDGKAIGQLLPGIVQGSAATKTPTAR